MSPEQALYDRCYHIMRVAERIEDRTRFNVAWRWIQFGLLVSILIKVW